MLQHLFFSSSQDPVTDLDSLLCAVAGTDCLAVVDDSPNTALILYVHGGRKKTVSYCVKKNQNKTNIGVPFSLLMLASELPRCIK